MPTAEQLTIAWNSVFLEYCDLAPNNNTIYTVQLTREIAHLESKINIIQAIIDRLSVSYISELCDILRDYGFYYEFTPETMFADLQAVVGEAKMFVVQKGVKEGELKRLNDGQQKGEATTEAQYDEILSELSKFQGYHLKSKDLTVSEFCGIFNRYKKQSNNGKQPADR